MYCAGDEKNHAALLSILYPTPSQALFKLIPKEDLSKLPDDENTPEKRATKLWGCFEKKDNGRTCSGSASAQSEIISMEASATFL